MKVFLHIFFGVVLRIICYYSPFKELIRIVLMIFPMSPYSIQKMKENFVVHFYKSSNPTSSTVFQSDQIFIAAPLTILYNHIRNIDEIYILAFFIFCDVAIGLFCYKIKDHLSLKPTDCFIQSNEINDIKTNKNHFLIGLYLYNPISIISCASFSLSVPFTFLNLLFIMNSENIIMGSILLFLSTILTPGYAIMNYVYVLYQIIYRPKSKIYYILAGLMILFVNYFIVLNNVFNLLSYNPFENLCSIYNSYYFLKDSKPNFSFYWVLYASTFIKYQRFTLQIAIIYHLAICLACMFLVNLMKDKDYRFKPSLIYSLVFLVSLILDTYPPEIHTVIGLILVYQHWEVIKVKISTLGVYCTFASYLLVMSRGFPYYRRKTGQSNYLVSQNITHDIALSIAFMTSLNGIMKYKKKCKHIDKMNLLTKEIIGKAMDKITENYNNKNNMSINESAII